MTAKGPKQTVLERTLSIISVSVVLAALVWILIDGPALWPLVVTSFALALNPLTQLLYDRRLGRRGGLSFIMLVFLTSVGLLQLLFLTLDESPGPLPILIAAAMLLLIFLAIVLWDRELRHHPPAMHHWPEPPGPRPF